MRLLHKISENRKLIIVSSLSASLSSEHFYSYSSRIRQPTSTLVQSKSQKRVIRLGSVCMREGCDRVIVERGPL